MTELTSEEIENLRDGMSNHKFNALCNLALKGLGAEKITQQRDALLVIAKEVQAALGRLAAHGMVSTAFNGLLSQVNVAIAAVEDVT